ncbi:MAG: hypothetical protein U1F83_00100 [Verrucomicrobiota bacterium]
MKTSKLLGLLALVASVSTVFAQTVSINILLPGSGAVVHDSLYVAATASATYEVQTVQASIDGRVASLVYTSSAYTNCPLGMCSPQPGWAGNISLTGLAPGAKTLTVTAIDVFGNSNATQRSVTYDLPPTLTVTAPMNATVARPEVVISASATDDNPAGVKIDVFQDSVGGALLASGTNNLNATLNFGGADGGIVTLAFRALDSAGQAKLSYRQVYVQSSSNLVEIANVSDGRIMDVQPDRILFQTIKNDPLPPGYSSSETECKLLIKSRANGTEALTFFKTNMSIVSGFLSQGGATLVASGSPYAGFVTGYALFQTQGGAEALLATHGLAQIALLKKGNFAAWGWGMYFGFNPQIYRTDLQTADTVSVTTDPSATDISFDLAANGDVVFAPVNGYGSHTIYRFRNGINSLLASIPGNQSTNQLVAPKTDGDSVYYIQITPTNNILKKIGPSGEVTLAQGFAIGGDYQLNNGWVAYARNGGGQNQIWRCSPAGTNTQLTFYGTASSLAALSPDGETAFFNGTHLYTSKGTWPPAEIATATPGSGLTVFWQDGRWCATLGRSLFQIYTGTPQLISRNVSGNNFGLGLIGAKGQSLVTECTTDFVHWTAIATNAVTDGANLEVQDQMTVGIPGKMYRLRLQ